MISRYRFMLVLIHWLIQAKFLARMLLHHLVGAARRAFPFMDLKVTGGPLDRVARDAESMAKIPQHVALAIAEAPSAESDTSVFDWRSLAESVCWLSALGVKDISIYDPNGVCVDHQNDIRQEIEQASVNLVASNARSHRQKTPLQLNIRVVGCDKASDKSASAPSSMVRLLSRHDGRPAVMDVVRKHCSAVKGHVKTVDDVHESDFDSGLCDPELLIVFGKTFTVDGYPPWALRVTEIAHVETHRLLSYASLLRALDVFNRCEQRCGK